MILGALILGLLALCIGIGAGYLSADNLSPFPLILVIALALAHESGKSDDCNLDTPALCGGIE
ncbi:hypothetical protein [Pectobacterium versatile]|uniref:hypothetical protein n=1 Tax=Pectobacterium versatile TaxID=2488639 RepID=UPI003019546C